MVDFEANDGLSVDGDRARIDISKLPDQVVLRMLQESRAVAIDRGMEVESATGRLALGGTAELSAGEWRGLLIETVGQSASWYTKVAGQLAEGRDAEAQVPIVPEDELSDRAAAWLDQERLAAIEAGLTYDAENPPMLLAIPNIAVSHQEIIRTWAAARAIKARCWEPGLEFLRQWPADRLSGFSPSAADEPVRFAAIETGRAKDHGGDRAGTRDEQLTALDEIQHRHPTVRPASLFEGGIYVNRFSDREFFDWSKSYVCQIELEPDNSSGGGRIPAAKAGALGTEGFRAPRADWPSIASRRLVS